LYIINRVPIVKAQIKKTEIMKSLTILITLCSIILNSYAQDEVKRTNYVITNSGDTINGTFNEKLSFKGVFNVVFIDTEGRETVYRPGELKRFSNNHITYVNKVIFTLSGSSKAFLRLEVEGYVNVYSSELVNDGGPGILAFEGQYYLEKDGGLERVKNIGFANTMKKYFSDDSEIVSKINTRSYLYSNTPAMVRAYNKKKEASDF